MLVRGSKDAIYSNLVFTGFLSFAPIFVFFAPFLVYESSSIKSVNIKPRMTLLIANDTWQ
jgi:hypothetical protein